MRIVIFCHSVLSDWNNGNAHFMRGIVSELQARGHRVYVYEPRQNWSLSNLRADQGEGPLVRLRRLYPRLQSVEYDPETIDLVEVLEGVDLAIVHEWNAPDIIRRIGAVRLRSRGLTLLFHDTHHRSASDRAGLGSRDLRGYDGVLAYGEAIRQIYLELGWTKQAWTWHEAADTRVFRPIPGLDHEGDLVWIGNWGDGERDAELRTFLIDPVRELGLRARAFGVRYPETALRALAADGIPYSGWLPNYEVPCVYARFRATVHIPRNPYVKSLPGIPTIRVFEALACGIPLVSSPWEDAEGLFRAGEDFLIASDGEEMKRYLREVLEDEDLRRALARNGLRTIRERHTCAHRVDELLAIHAKLSGRTHEEALVS